MDLLLIPNKSRLSEMDPNMLKCYITLVDESDDDGNIITHEPLEGAEGTILLISGLTGLSENKTLDAFRKLRLMGVICNDTAMVSILISPRQKLVTWQK